MKEKNENFIDLVWEITNLTEILNEYVSYLIRDGKDYYNYFCINENYFRKINPV